MTDGDVIRMAREAGATREHPEMLPNFWTLTNPDLKRFANLVAAEEREACAKTAMELLFVYIGSYPINEQFADAIRERGKG